MQQTACKNFHWSFQTFLSASGHPNHNNELHSPCFVFHMFRVSVSTFQVGQALFFALNIYLSLRDNWDYLSLATIKFQPIRNHDQITRHTAVWIARAQMTKYGHAISRQKINFSAERNACFDTFRKSMEVFSAKMFLYFWDVYDVNPWDNNFGRSTTYSCRTNVFI